MQNAPNYQQIALQILSTNDLQLYQEFSKCLLDPPQLTEILNLCIDSQEMLFVVASILLKKILARQYINPDDQLNSNQNANYQNKKSGLIDLISRLWFLLNKMPMVNHVFNTVVNCMAVAMKCLSELPNSRSNFTDCMKSICQNFTPNELFCAPLDNQMPEIISSAQTLESLPKNYSITVSVFTSMLEYITSSSYFNSYYLYRKHIYDFRTVHLSFILNYNIKILKSIFNTYNRAQNKMALLQILRPVVKLFEAIIMYPYTLRIHESELEDDVHDNIAGLNTEIYFPTYFRGYLCDTSLLFDLAGYLISLIKQSTKIDDVREQLNLLIRIIGRTISTADYIFGTDEERINFRQVSIQMLINIIMEQKYFDQYYFLCLSKIFIKVLVVYSNKDFGGNRQFFYESVINFLKNAMINVRCSIQDGQKNQIRLIFDILVAMIHSQDNEQLNKSIQVEAQHILRLFFQKLTDNQENDRMIAQFGENNPQQTQCFEQIFMKVSQIFKLESQNLQYLRDLDLSMISKSSLTFWLHLCAILLPEHDTSQQQTQLILKFFHAAVNARSIASLHYINTLLTEILTEVEDGISVTYLWKFMQESLGMDFQKFLTQIISYTINIFTIPNYTLIQNGLDLFKNLFTKLCKIKHKSYKKYFLIVEQVSRKIDETMLVHPDYVKLRIDFFSVISMVWISQNQLQFVYKILENIRNSLGSNLDLLHFMRYLIDVTGILDPVQSHEIFKILVQLILTDLDYLLPNLLGNEEKIKVAFNEEQFLRAFMRFLLQLVNDFAYRLTYQTHSDLGIRIEQTFRPYLLAALNFDFPKKTVEIYQKFIKLNPLSPLLPFKKQFKQKNPNLYKALLRQYFENLSRLQTEDQFYYMYGLIEENVELMSDWWEEVMARDIRPNINVSLVINARIWSTSRQKQNFAKMLYRISRYDPRYFQIEGFGTESAYSKWFVQNYQ